MFQRKIHKKRGEPVFGGVLILLFLGTFLLCACEQKPLDSISYVQRGQTNMMLAPSLNLAYLENVFLANSREDVYVWNKIFDALQSKGFSNPGEAVSILSDLGFVKTSGRIPEISGNYTHDDEETIAELKKFFPETWEGIRSFLFQWKNYVNPAALIKPERTFFVLKGGKDGNVIWRNMDKEYRFYVSLHSRLLNQDGPRISVAALNPKSAQPFHSHPEGGYEFFFPVDGDTTIRLEKDGKMVEQEIKPRQIAAIPADQLHTLYNHTDTLSRNITVFLNIKERSLEKKMGGKRGNVVINLREGAEQSLVFSQEFIESDGRYMIERIELSPGQKTEIVPLKEQLSGTTEVVISFSDTIIQASDGENTHGLSNEDVLCIRPRKGPKRYSLYNTGKIKAVAYRVVLLGSRSTGNIVLQSLSPGGTLFRIENPNNNIYSSSSGIVSVGMFMAMHQLFGDTQEIPKYIIAPQGSWIGRNGENLMQLYFRIFANYFRYGTRTTLVATSAQWQRIQEYLKMGNPDLFLPESVAGFDEKTQREYLAEQVVNADRQPSQEANSIVSAAELVDFVPFDENGEAEFASGTIKVTAEKNGTFVVQEKGKLPAVLEGRAEHMQELTAHFKNASKLFRDTKTGKVISPDFGITVLGQSSGMNPSGLTSNFVLQAGDFHVLYDVGSLTLAELEAVGMTAGDITHLLVTHMHEDHVAGVLALFHRVKELNRPIRLLIEPGTYEFFRRQMSAVLGKDLEQVFAIEKVWLPFNKTITLRIENSSIEIETERAWHLSPTLMTRVTYKGKTFAHSSDHTYDPARYEKILKNELPEFIRTDLATYGFGSDELVFDNNRKEALSYPDGFLFKKNAYGKRPVCLHEAVLPSAMGEFGYNHTTFEALGALPEEVQRRMLIHHNIAGIPYQASMLFQQAYALTTYRITERGFIPDNSFLAKLIDNPLMIQRLISDEGATIKELGLEFEDITRDFDLLEEAGFIEVTGNDKDTNLPTYRFNDILRFPKRGLGKPEESAVVRINDVQEILRRIGPMLREDASGAVIRREVLQEIMAYINSQGSEKYTPSDFYVIIEQAI